jgi:pimeloyl-ACP methyl ester carboxylesterase
MKLAHDSGGHGARLLVLLHGLGATRHVWQNLLDTHHWRDRWIAPDLRGHGASAHAADYSLAAHANDVAELIQSTGPAGDVIVVGHSMGGAIALALASGIYSMEPSRTFGLGIKVVWSDAELSGMHKMVAMPVKIFENKEEAVSRYLKISGLHGLVPADSGAAQAGVVHVKDGWRLAFDPATASIGPPPMKELIAAAGAPIHLACGETDHMVTREQLAAYDPNAWSLVGGHNVMVENPQAVWAWIDALSA